MELSQVMEERRSVRHYNDKKLDQKIVEDILNYAILSPSAHNRQPWHFIVIENQGLKKEIGDLLQSKMGDIAQVTSNVIRESQVLILVFADITEEIMNIVSVGACIENMILRARDLDVASLWIGYILNIEEELKNKFALDKKLISAVALGYTDHFPSKRPRKELNEVSELY